MTLLSAVPPSSTFSLSAVNVDGLDKEATDPRVCVANVLEVVPKSFSPACRSDVKGSMGSIGGMTVFSRSKSAINKVSDIDGMGVQAEIADRMDERQHEQQGKQKYSNHNAATCDKSSKQWSSMASAWSEESEMRLSGQLHAASVGIEIHQFGRMALWCKSAEGIALVPHTASMTITTPSQ